MKFIRNKKYLFFIFIIIVSLLKIVLTSNLPIYAITTASADDRMMVYNAKSLLELKWLGSYNQFTLVKGMFFPFFLAVSCFLGISYLNSITISYIISSLFFIYVLSNKIKSKKRLSLIYVVLLFNPVSFSTDTFLRVYRNSLTASQVLIIFSSLLNIYFKINDNYKVKELIFSSIIAGLSVASLFLTREDAIWIMPFFIVITIFCIIKVYFDKSRIKKKVIILILPFLILFLSNNIISLINYKYYGIYTTNEINNSNFTKVMKSIYAVKPEKNIEYVSVTNEKLNRMFKYSKSLRTIKKELIKSCESYGSYDRKPNDGEVEDGWFWWALRDAVEKKGYYNKGAKYVNNYYLNVSSELEGAMNAGKLDRVKTMPSALMSPWRKGYTNKLLSTFAKAIKYTVTFDEVKVDIRDSIDDNDIGISVFKSITNDNIIIGDRSSSERNVSNYYVKRLNIFTSIYQKLNVFIAILSIIGYIYLIIKNIKIKDKDDFEVIIMLTGILGSYIVLLFGVSYNHISSCHSITYLYLSASYILMILFEFISLVKTYDKLKIGIK